nr:hypothetical protein [uncultured bacterium]
MTKDTRKTREILRRAENARDDAQVRDQLERDGITIGETEELDRDELLRLLDDDDPDALPSITICFQLDEHDICDRADIEDQLSDYIERNELGEWIGSGQGSIGDSEFFDVTFELVNLENALAIVRNKLLAMKVGKKTVIHTSDDRAIGLHDNSL